MKTLLLVCVLFISAAGHLQAAEQFRDVKERIPFFIYNKQTYTNAVLEKAGLEVGLVRIDAGLVRVKLTDLPEPIRSRVYNPDLVAAKAAEKAAAKKLWDDARKAALEKAEKEKQASIAQDNPLRIVGGNLYDLSEVILRNKGTGWTYIVGRFFFTGKVLSINHDGILVRTDASSGPNEIVFLKNHPHQGGLVDDAKLSVVACLAGRYEYQSVSGAKKTVPLYDYGEPYSGKVEDFHGKAFKVTKTEDVIPLK